VLLADLNDFGVVNEIYKQCMSLNYWMTNNGTFLSIIFVIDFKEPYPARMAYQVAKLPLVNTFPLIEFNHINSHICTYCRELKLKLMPLQSLARWSTSNPIYENFWCGMEEIYSKARVCSGMNAMYKAGSETINFLLKSTIYHGWCFCWKINSRDMKFKI